MSSLIKNVKNLNVPVINSIPKKITPSLSSIASANLSNSERTNENRTLRSKSLPPIPLPFKNFDSPRPSSLTQDVLLGCGSTIRKLIINPNLIRPTPTFKIMSKRWFTQKSGKSKIKGVCGENQINKKKRRGVIRDSIATVPTLKPYPDKNGKGILISDKVGEIMNSAQSKRSLHLLKSNNIPSTSFQINFNEKLMSTSKDLPKDRANTIKDIIDLNEEVKTRKYKESIIVKQGKNKVCFHYLSPRQDCRQCVSKNRKRLLDFYKKNISKVGNFSQKKRYFSYYSKSSTKLEEHETTGEKEKIIVKDQNINDGLQDKSLSLFNLIKFQTSSTGEFIPTNKYKFEAKQRPDIYKIMEENDKKREDQYPLEMFNDDVATWNLESAKDMAPKPKNVFEFRPPVKESSKNDGTILSLPDAANNLKYEFSGCHDCGTGEKETPCKIKVPKKKKQTDKCKKPQKEPPCKRRNTCDQGHTDYKASAVNVSKEAATSKLYDFSGCSKDNKNTRKPPIKYKPDTGKCRNQNRCNDFGGQSLAQLQPLNKNVYFADDLFKQKNFLDNAKKVNSSDYLEICKMEKLNNLDRQKFISGTEDEVYFIHPKDDLNEKLNSAFVSTPKVEINEKSKDMLAKAIKKSIQPIIEKEFLKYDEVKEAVERMEKNLDNCLKALSKSLHVPVVSPLSIVNQQPPVKLKYPWIKHHHDQIIDKNDHPEINDPTNTKFEYRDPKKISSIDIPSDEVNNSYKEPEHENLDVAFNKLAKKMNKIRIHATGIHKSGNSYSEIDGVKKRSKFICKTNDPSNQGDQFSKKADSKKDPCKKEDSPKKNDACKKEKEDPCKKKEDTNKKKDSCVKADSKKDPCKKEDPCKKDDPCKEKEDPCKKKEDSSKKKDPCVKADSKKDPCKKEDPCKKNDPCKEIEDPCKNKDDLCKKKDPCIKADSKKDPCKKEDPCKKDDPCKEKEDPCKKKDDPCKKKDPCIKADTKKDPCKKEDPCKKDDPCKEKEDPCKKKEDPCKKDDPCKKKSCDPFAPIETNKVDPCNNFCQRNEDPCSRQTENICPEKSYEDPCGNLSGGEIKCRKSRPPQRDCCRVPPSCDTSDNSFNRKEIKCNKTNIPKIRQPPLPEACKKTSSCKNIPMPENCPLKPECAHKCPEVRSPSCFQTGCKTRPEPIKHSNDEAKDPCATNKREHGFAGMREVAKCDYTKNTPCSSCEVEKAEPEAFIEISQETPTENKPTCTNEERPQHMLSERERRYCDTEALDKEIEAMKRREALDEMRKREREMECKKPVIFGESSKQRWSPVKIQNKKMGDANIIPEAIKKEQQVKKSKSHETCTDTNKNKGIVETCSNKISDLCMMIIRKHKGGKKAAPIVVTLSRSQPNMNSICRSEGPGMMFDGGSSSGSGKGNKFECGPFGLFGGGKKNSEKDTKSKEEQFLKIRDDCKTTDQSKTKQSDDSCIQKKEEPLIKCKSKETDKKPAEIKEEDPYNCVQKKEEHSAKGKNKETDKKQAEVEEEDPYNCVKRKKSKETENNDLCKKKKEDPCKKEKDPCAKEEDPCKGTKKKDDPCATKKDPCVKKADPCAKKEDPSKAKKKKDLSAKKNKDPCKKKKELSEKKDDCKETENKVPSAICNEINSKTIKKSLSQKNEDSGEKKEIFYKKDHSCKIKMSQCQTSEDKKKIDCKNDGNMKKKDKTKNNNKSIEVKADSSEATMETEGLCKEKTVSKKKECKDPCNKPIKRVICSKNNKKNKYPWNSKCQKKSQKKSTKENANNQAKDLCPPKKTTQCRTQEKMLKKMSECENGEKEGKGKEPKDPCETASKDHQAQKPQEVCKVQCSNKGNDGPRNKKDDPCKKKEDPRKKKNNSDKKKKDKRKKNDESKYKKKCLPYFGIISVGEKKRNLVQQCIGLDRKIMDTSISGDDTSRKLASFQDETMHRLNNVKNLCKERSMYVAYNNPVLASNKSIHCIKPKTSLKCFHTSHLYQRSNQEIPQNDCGSKSAMDLFPNRKKVDTFIGIKHYCIIKKNAKDAIDNSNIENKCEEKKSHENENDEKFNTEINLKYHGPDLTNKNTEHEIEKKCNPSGKKEIISDTKSDACVKGEKEQNEAKSKSCEITDEKRETPSIDDDCSIDTTKDDPCVPEIKKLPSCEESFHEEGISEKGAKLCEMILKRQEAKKTEKNCSSQQIETTKKDPCGKDNTSSDNISDNERLDKDCIKMKKEPCKEDIVKKEFCKENNKQSNTSSCNEKISENTHDYTSCMKKKILVSCDIRKKKQSKKNNDKLQKLSKKKSNKKSKTCKQSKKKKSNKGVTEDIYKEKEINIGKNQKCAKTESRKIDETALTISTKKDTKKAEDPYNCVKRKKSKIDKGNESTEAEDPCQKQKVATPIKESVLTENVSNKSKVKIEESCQKQKVATPKKESVLTKNVSKKCEVKTEDPCQKQKVETPEKELELTENISKNSEVKTQDSCEKQKVVSPETESILTENVSKKRKVKTQDPCQKQKVPTPEKETVLTENVSKKCEVKTEYPCQKQKVATHEKKPVLTENVSKKCEVKTEDLCQKQKVQTPERESVLTENISKNSEVKTQEPCQQQKVATPENESVLTENVSKKCGVKTEDPCQEQKVATPEKESILTEEYLKAKNRSDKSKKSLKKKVISDNEDALESSNVSRTNRNGENADRFHEIIKSSKKLSSKNIFTKRESKISAGGYQEQIIENTCEDMNKQEIEKCKNALNKNNVTQTTSNCDVIMQRKTDSCEDIVKALRKSHSENLCKESKEDYKKHQKEIIARTCEEIKKPVSATDVKNMNSLDNCSSNSQSDVKKRHNADQTLIKNEEFCNEINEGETKTCNSFGEQKDKTKIRTIKDDNEIKKCPSRDKYLLKEPKSCDVSENQKKQDMSINKRSSVEKDQSVQRGLKGLTSMLPDEYDERVKDMGILNQCALMTRKSKTAIVEPISDEEARNLFCSGKETIMCKVKKMGTGEKLVCEGNESENDLEKNTCDLQDDVQRVLKCAIIKDKNNKERFVCMEMHPPENDEGENCSDKSKQNKIKVTSNKLVCRKISPCDEENGGNNELEMVCQIMKVEEIKTPNKNKSSSKNQLKQKKVKHLITYQELMKKKCKERKNDYQTENDHIKDRKDEICQKRDKRSKGKGKEVGEK